MKSRKIRMASLMLAGVITLGLFAGCSKDASQSSTSGGSKDSIVIATIGASNKTRLNNPEVDALIDQACATIDEAEREEVLRQCNTLINELCPPDSSVPGCVPPGLQRQSGRRGDQCSRFPLFQRCEVERITKLLTLCGNRRFS